MKILIPLDGSEMGEAAIPFVKDILSTMSPRAKLEYILLQVVSLRSHYVPVGDVMAPVAYTEVEMEQIKKNSLDYLKKISKRLKTKGSVLETRIEMGSVADEIIRVADEMNVDLIAMSTHGRHGISRWAFGSVTDKVLRAGLKPVLVVRPTGEEAKQSSV
ncbi:universal stress protein [Chloroflexota bacterium]